MGKAKCTGHICFWVHLEYFEVPGGQVYEAPWDNPLDPDGYRLGATPYVYREHKREDVLRCIQEIIDKYTELGCKCAHQEDGDVLRLPIGLRSPCPSEVP